MKTYHILLTSILILLLHVSAVSGQTITTITVHEKAGITTTNYPLTFAIPFKKGDITAGIIIEHEGVDLTTQFDIKRTWANGSVKHAIISVIIPKVDANAIETLLIKPGPTNSTTGAMDKTAILATDVESVIALTNLSGSNNPATASASLLGAINDGNIEYWMQGAVCTEILYDIKLTPNDNLHARWEVRFYPGTQFGIRISNIVESVNLSALGMSAYDVTISQGANSPSQIYTFTNFSHSYGSRWRKTFWLGNEPPEIEIHYDIGYLISSNMILPIDSSITVNPVKIDSLYNVLKNKQNVSSTYPLGIRGGDDIDGSGNIYRPFPMVGGRDELGISPSWQALYLLSYDNKLREITLKNGDISGQAGASHYREGDNTKEFYSKAAVSLNSRPNMQLWYPKDDIPAFIGDVTNDPNDWNADRAHQGSFVYLPYLITGEHYYMEELSFWASFDLGYTAYGRNGKGSSQDFSSSFSEGVGAGIIYDEMRAVAWSMRNISDAINILPNNQSAIAAYFKGRLNNTLNWLYMGNTTTSHGMHILRVPRELSWNTNPNYKLLVASWMHDFNIIVMSDMIRKEESVENLQSLISLRDMLGEFTTGRFTNHPDFNKWDGVGYWWPLNKPGGDYFTSGSWSEYYTHFLEHNEEDSAHHQTAVPHSDFAYYQADSMSYLYIAKGALAQLTNLTNGAEAYNFINTQSLSSEISKSPQWGGLIPATGYIPPTCVEAPSACGDQSSCEAANWYWYDNACNATAEPTCTTASTYCATEVECTTASWYWCTDICQDISCQGSSDTPNVKRAYVVP